MKVINYAYQNTIQFDKPINIALGLFDGLHNGHVSLINKAIENSKLNDGYTVVMTFNPNPLITLGKINQEQYLTSIKDKEEILSKIGVDYLVIIDFTKQVSELDAKEFYDSFIKPLPIKSLICGFDFHFGKKGSGDGETLKNLVDNNCIVNIIEEVSYNNKKVSTTNVKEALSNGNVEVANILLGRNYKIKGNVIKGRQIGRTIGCPTANVEYGDYFLPKRGVYATIVTVKDKQYYGMCNIGYNPTFNKLNRPSMEVNIFDFDEDIYDVVIDVEFVSFIRNEKKFNSPQELIEQLSNDRANIAVLFKI